MYKSAKLYYKVANIFLVRTSRVDHSAEVAIRKMP